MDKDQKPDPKREPKIPAAETAKRETGDASKVPKPDPVRYGDWTVNGIAVDF